MANLKKRADGRYQKSVQLPDGSRKMIYAKSQKELLAKAEAIQQYTAAGINVSQDMPVYQWAEYWLQNYKTGLRAKTLEMYANICNLHIFPCIGNMQLSGVRQVHCRQILAGVSHCSESLQHKVLITLRQLFGAARQNRLILADPTDGLKITPRKQPEKKKHLTRPEHDALMQAVCALPDKRAAALCGLMLYCGLRREEALGLQWASLGQSSLTVCRAVTFLGNAQDPVHELKTKASYRTLPIPSPLAAILSTVPRRGPDVIPAADGGPITRQAFKRLWDKIQAVCPFHVTPHMLRHTYATSLYHAGIDLRTAQSLLGHASIQMTAQVYTHLEKEDTLAAAQKIEGYYAPLALAQAQAQA